MFNRTAFLVRAFGGVIILTGVLPSCLAPRETFPTLTSALDSIGAKFHVRFGLEYEASDKDRNAFALNLGGGTVAQVMDQLISQKPRYKWKLVDGIYDIYPKDRGDRITAVKIKAFHISDGSF